MPRTLATAALLALAACATPITVTAPFVAEEVAYVSTRGSATVSGQAFMRQMGGGVVTCAGEEVMLIPAGRYATELMTRMFGNPQGGRMGALSVMAPSETPTQFREMQRRAQCDAEGDFAFSGVANGPYYVLTRVIWTAGDSFVPEGGYVARRIEVRGGRDQRVLLN